MSYQSIDFGAMEQAYASFEQKYNQMDSELNDLMKGLESKLGQWEDEAREAFFLAVTEWNATAEEISQALQQLGAGISSSTETAQSTVKNNAALFRA